MLRIAFLILLILLLLPAPALAQWETTAVAPQGGEPTPVFAASGRALVVHPDGGALRLSGWRPGAAPVPGDSLRGSLFAEPLRVGAHRVLVPLLTGPPEQQRLSAAVVGISGRVLESPRRIRPFRIAYAPAAAAGPGGEVALAWVEPYGRDQQARLRLRLAIRSGGGGFGRARVVADLGADDHPGPAAVGLAYASGGRLVLAFTLERSDGRRQVHALIGRPGRWRRQVLGLHRGIADMAAAANARGRVVVGWQTQDGGEEGNEPAEVRAALLEPRARRFSRTRLLDPGTGIGRWPGRIAAAMSPGGTAALTWSQMAGRETTYPVVAATAAPGDGFGPLIALDANGAAGDVAFAADGRLLATWARITSGNYQQPDQVFAAQRPEGAAAFAPAEPVSGDDGASPPAATVDPSTGRFVVGWALWPRYPSQDPRRPFLSVRAP